MFLLSVLLVRKYAQQLHVTLNLPACRHRYFPRS